MTKRNKLLKYEEYIKGDYSRRFNENVVFYPQNQDDEGLWGRSAIINIISQCGKDNVYVVLISDGPSVNV